VERTLLSAAFDLDLDFDFVEPRTDQWNTVKERRFSAA
jgi:hypothetical protein